MHLPKRLASSRITGANGGTTLYTVGSSPAKTKVTQVWAASMGGTQGWTAEVIVGTDNPYNSLWGGINREKGDWIAADIDRLLPPGELIRAVTANPFSGTSEVCINAYGYEFAPPASGPLGAIEEKRLAGASVTAGSWTTLYTAPSPRYAIVREIYVSHAVENALATWCLAHIPSGGTASDTHAGVLIGNSPLVPLGEGLRIRSAIAMAPGDFLAVKSVGATTHINLQGVEVLP